MGKQEFQKWLEENKLRLLRYEAWEIARLGLAIGFKMDDMVPDLSLWLSKSQRMLRLWESPLFEHWLSLHLYQHGKDEWL